MAGPLSQFPVSSPSPTLRLNIVSCIKVVRLHLLLFRTLTLVCQRNKLLLVFWFSNTILKPSCPEEDTWYGRARYTPVVSYAKGKTLKHDEPLSLHKIIKLKCSMKVLGYGMWNLTLMSRGDTWISHCRTSIYHCKFEHIMIKQEYHRRACRWYSQVAHRMRKLQYCTEKLQFSIMRLKFCIVRPLLSGHTRDFKKWPLNRGLFWIG